MTIFILTLAFIGAICLNNLYQRQIRHEEKTKEEMEFIYDALFTILAENDGGAPEK